MQLRVSHLPDEENLVLKYFQGVKGPLEVSQAVAVDSILSVVEASLEASGAGVAEDRLLQ